MKVYDAIMKAADHIEQHPKGFNFMLTGIPTCRTPGCALGWIGVFCGAPRSITEVSKNFLKLPPVLEAGYWSTNVTFYNRMNDLGGEDWKWNAASCAKALRLYAEKYHGDEKPTQPREETVPWSALPWQPSERARA